MVSCDPTLIRAAASHSGEFMPWLSGRNHTAGILRKPHYNRYSRHWLRRTDDCLSVSGHLVFRIRAVPRLCRLITSLGKCEMLPLADRSRFDDDGQCAEKSFAVRQASMSSFTLNFTLRVNGIREA